MSKIDVEDAQRLREAYSNLLKEVESNQIIASPAANTKGCKSRLRVSGYESVQKDLVSFPQDLARKIRLVYRDIAQENQYIEKIERMGFDKFRQEFPMEPHMHNFGGQSEGPADCSKVKIGINSFASKIARKQVAQMN